VTQTKILEEYHTLPMTSNKTNIPCLYLRAKDELYRDERRKFIIAFHANGEDLGTAYRLLDTLRTRLNHDVLLVEYPGYGIYQNKDEKLAAEDMARQIIEDAECVYDFVLENITDVVERDIVVLGRSLGSGPCIHLGAVRNPSTLILCSPFRSIKAVVKEKFAMLSALFDTEFDNITKIKEIH
jgi:abhydrolase domain-containing protein 17